MNVTIKFCRMCGGETQAQQVADEIEKHMGIKSVLEDVGRGRFEIFVNDKEVWSKREHGRFPHSAEMVRLFKSIFK